MKTASWIAAFAGLVACGKAADSKQDPGALQGFYRVESVDIDGKRTSLADAMQASVKGEYQLAFFRMTMELADGEVAIGIDQIMRAKSAAIFCSATARTDLVVAGGKLQMPSLRGVASGGAVSHGSHDTKDTMNCNVAMPKGTYDITGGGKAVQLSTIVDGKHYTMNLVADEKSIDLKARAAELVR